ncbi:MAG: hypothetical protein EBY46_08615 [Rhodobacteraceae bacterium]|nr:hypothetical protein [Paracoccaceae bacterium]
MIMIATSVISTLARSSKTTLRRLGDIWGLGKRGSGSDVLYENGKLRETIGAVLYWDTPIGPLRFDFTRALTKQEFDNERSFDLSVATQF